MSDETATGFRVLVDGPVATVTLDRPQVRNAQTPALWAGLTEFARGLTGDVRVVVLRGEGRSFSAGLDLSVVAGGEFQELARISPQECADRIAEFQQAFTWLRRPDLITVAAVQGHAIGAGFQLALACDLRIAADDAVFSMAEVTLGLVPDLTGTKRLVDLVGYGRALELCVTGRRVGAAEAERIGLANLVVARDELDAATSDLVQAVLAGPRDAVVEIKALLAGASGRGHAEQERAEREAQTRRIRDLAGLGE
ncbi:enoyl-CoA hydratase/isomerase family protein [Catellatospora sp. TT07R-123]|uniref:enoyl-CoA hydratase/isomerase family protein n=1 Tax=Catellatospora sp. TT07R-123 TaxID=2733863 RepID=UPI001BB2FC9A|nr:enoyl-CoA hydratase/isomerase family protein [Catellatospora sp. TT07R-123]